MYGDPAVLGSYISLFGVILYVSGISLCGQLWYDRRVPEDIQFCPAFVLGTEPVFRGLLGLFDISTSHFDLCERVAPLRPETIPMRNNTLSLEVSILPMAVLGASLRYIVICVRSSPIMSIQR